MNVNLFIGYYYIPVCFKSSFLPLPNVALKFKPRYRYISKKSPDNCCANNYITAKNTPDYYFLIDIDIGNFWLRLNTWVYLKFCCDYLMSKKNHC